MSSSTGQLYFVVDYIETLRKWFLSKLFIVTGRPEANHALQRFLSESVELLRRFSSLKLAHLSLAILVIIVLVLGLFWALWRLRVSRYNEFWGLKKSVHFWTSFQTSAQPHYCSACRQLICGFWIFRNTGWECTICGRTAHMRCVAACDKFDCKCPSQSEPLRHQLVQGNLPSDSVCGVCGIICASPFGLHGLRCLWCGRTVHEECLRHLPEICDLGPFRSLVLPPSIVRLSVASSRLPNSLQSFGALFHARKSSEAAEVSTTATDLSASAQRYMRSMGTQLKEGLSQVQMAMAAGLFEGLKEVTADVRRINQLVRQEFRRRMKRELHQQHIEERMMELGTKELESPSPLQQTQQQSTAIVSSSSAINSEEAVNSNLPEKSEASLMNFSNRSLRPLRRSSSTPTKGVLQNDCQQLNENAMHGCTRSSSLSADDGSFNDNLRACFSPMSERSRSQRKKCLISSTYCKQGEKQQFLVDSTTTDETPEAVGGSEVVSMSSGKPATMQSSSGQPVTSESSKSESLMNGELPGMESLQLEDIGQQSQPVGSTTTTGPLSPRVAVASTSSDARPSMVSQSAAFVAREARLRHRQQRLRRLEQKRLTAVAGALVAREDRYGDRLFELAKLMPAKADVWEVELPELLPSSTHHRWTGTAETKRIKQRSRPGNKCWNIPFGSYPLDKHSSTGNENVPMSKIASATHRTAEIPQASEMLVPNSLMERRPLLVFVNVKSGGQVGAQLLKEFYKLLNPMQVVDIQSDGGPQRALQLFKGLADIDRLRVLVCGGDGTAGWVIDEIRRLYGPPTQCHVPVGILPLGTGNDLARVLGWGDSFDGDVQRCLIRVQSAQTRLLDQWTVKVADRDQHEIIHTCFNNYMDIGVAARIALKFHQLREAHPELFQSRLGNKFLYGEMGVREWVTERTLDLSKVKLWCDGLPVILPERKIEGLIVVNIPSFSGGVNLWSDEDVDQTTIDFHRYRLDHHAAVGFYDPPLYHPSASSAMFKTGELNSNDHSKPRWKKMKIEDDPTSSKIDWASRCPGPVLLSPSKNESFRASSTSRPPLPPRLHKHDFSAQSNSPCRDFERDSTSAWKRQGRQRSFGRNEGVTRSVEPRHSRSSLNKQRSRDKHREVMSNTFYQSIEHDDHKFLITKSSDPSYSNSGVHLNSLHHGQIHGKSSNRHHRCNNYSLGELKPGFSPPYATPRESSHDSFQNEMSHPMLSSETDTNISNGLQRDRFLEHPKENSRSVAASRNPHRNGWTAAETVNGASCATTETTSDGEMHSTLVTHAASSGIPSSSIVSSHHNTPLPISINRTSPTIGGMLRRWQKQSMRDELIEVVAVRSLFHLGQIQVGLAEPLRVCQGRDIRIEVPVEVPFQIDGEPRLLPPSTTIDIGYKGKNFVLSPVRSHDDALMLTVSEVLDAAVRDSVLTGFQRNCLVWELSKRL